MLARCALLMAAAWLLLVGPSAAHPAQVQLAIGANSCSVVGLTEEQLAGEPVRVVAQMAAVGGSEALTADDGAAGCRRSHFTLRGMEEGSDTAAAACQTPAVLLIPSSAGSVEGQRAAAYLTIQSSCHHPAVLTLDFSVDAPASRLALNAGAAGSAGPWRRALLQTPTDAGAAAAAAAQPASIASPAPASASAPTNEPQPTGSSGDGVDRNIPALDQQSSGGDTKFDPRTSQQACCCRYAADPLPFNPTEQADNNCCCGDYKACCGGKDLLSRMCGDKSTCGVMLVVVSAVIITLVAMCAVGGLCYRRRRQQVRDQFQMEAYAAEQARRNPRSAEDVQCATMLALPEDMQGDISVRTPGLKEIGVTADCPVCLEAITADEDNWRIFPCSHGACGSCVVDLVRHNLHTEQEHKRVVHCPMCRQMAVVPLSSLPATWMAPPSDGSESSDGPAAGDATVTVPAAAATPGRRTPRESFSRFITGATRWI